MASVTMEPLGSSSEDDELLMDDDDDEWASDNGESSSDTEVPTTHDASAKRDSAVGYRVLTLAQVESMQVRLKHITGGLRVALSRWGAATTPGATSRLALAALAGGGAAAGV
jgi:hypothetical protein